MSRRWAAMLTLQPRHMQTHPSQNTDPFTTRPGSTDVQVAPTNSTDRAVASSAAILEEAWAWGLDVDAWRGHLHALTWSEVLRQYALAAGWGPRRPRPKKQV